MARYLIILIFRRIVITYIERKVLADKIQCNEQDLGKMVDSGPTDACSLLTFAQCCDNTGVLGESKAR